MPQGDLSTAARTASQVGEWDYQPPKVFIDDWITATPDVLPRYTQDELDSAPRNQPSKLELYFLSRLPEIPDLGDESVPAGVLSARNSIEVCLRDEIRSKLFLEGTSAAIAQLEATTENDRNIEVCDAGCGAIPVLAIYAALCSDRVHCTAIEMNPESARLANTFVEVFGLQNQIQVIEGDARKFRPAAQIDLLISETMDAGLAREPLVDIMSNLQPQVRDDGIILPNGVTVSATLVPRAVYVQAERFVRIAGLTYPVLSPYTPWVSWQKVANYKPGDELERIDVSLSTTGYPTGEYFILVNSEVEIGPGLRLREYQSLLSMPQTMLDSEKDIANGITEEFAALFYIGSGGDPAINASYRPGQEPICRRYVT